VNCNIHPEREAVAACISCGGHVCQECDVLLARRHHCKKCLAEAERVPIDAPLVAPAPSGGKRMFRSLDDRVICGVCGGFAKYAELDPAIVRIAFVLLVVFTGVTLLAYPIAALAIPNEPEPVAQREA
jgi:phage shock protein C